MYTTIASALKVAGRFAPCVEHGFDTSTLHRRHAFPFEMGEWCMESSVYRCEDILDGHSGRVVGCDNPIPREEVRDDADRRDTRVYSQLGQMVGGNDLASYASGMAGCVTDVPVDRNWAEVCSPSGR